MTIKRNNQVKAEHLMEGDTIIAQGQRARVLEAREIKGFGGSDPHRVRVRTTLGIRIFEADDEVNIEDDSLDENQ